MLRLRGAVHDTILDHAREGAPREVCGVLGGERGGERWEELDGESLARTALPAENAADRPRSRYELDPAEQLQLMEEIEADGEEVVGFYHSHPSGPEGPSATDAAQATWEGYSYVICSLAGGPSVGSWRWTGEGFEREEVVVGEESADAEAETT